ncbi:MAG: site-specific integrase [Comamonas sp.]|uniref:site-specific integrase n=1 Tax=Comamonas sp. TaxID=34028 RepID=UPI002FC77BE7
MNASFKNSAAGNPSQTKHDFDDERKNTLPRGSAVNGQTTLAEASVMWDGPSPSGEGSRSEVLTHQGTIPSFAAGDAANSPTAMREVNLAAAPASPDAEHKTAEATHAQPSVSSSKWMSSPAQSANDAFFDSDMDSHARRLHVQQLIDQAPIETQPYLQQLHRLFEARKVEMHEAVVQAEAVFEEAQKLLGALKEARGQRKDTEPSSSTIAGYQRDCQHLDAMQSKLGEAPGLPWLNVLAHYAPNKRTFYSYRAALTWRAVKELQSRLNARKALELNGGKLAVLDLVPSIQAAMHELLGIRELTHKECMQHSHAAAKKSRSKKDDLQYLDDQWRDRFMQHIQSSPTYKHASVLLRHCGMRPEELDKGVQVELKKNKVVVGIEGAKVRETAGQPWRLLILDAQQLPAWFINDLSAHKIIKVQVKKDNFRKYLNGLTERVLRGAVRKNKTKVSLSAYLFRHQLATDLRENGWSSEEIAAVLGESVAETTRHYGIRVRSSKSPKSNVSVIRGNVQTARPVRRAHKTGLKQVIQKKTEATAKKR